MIISLFSTRWAPEPFTELHLPDLCAPRRQALAVDLAAQLGARRVLVTLNRPVPPLPQLYRRVDAEDLPRWQAEGWAEVARTAYQGDRVSVLIRRGG